LAEAVTDGYAKPFESGSVPGKTKHTGSELEILNFESPRFWTFPQHFQGQFWTFPDNFQGFKHFPRMSKTLDMSKEFARFWTSKEYPA